MTMIMPMQMVILWWQWGWRCIRRWIFRSKACCKAAQELKWEQFCQNIVTIAKNYKRKNKKIKKNTSCKAAQELKCEQFCQNIVTIAIVIIIVIMVIMIMIGICLTIMIIWMISARATVILRARFQASLMTTRYKFEYIIIGQKNKVFLISWYLRVSPWIYWSMIDTIATIFEYAYMHNATYLWLMYTTYFQQKVTYSQNIVRLN